MIKIFSTPASIRLRFGCGARAFFLALSLSSRSLVEPSQPLIRETFRFCAPAGRSDPQHVTGQLPIDLVPWFDMKSVRHDFRKRHLKFAGDLAHILTLARIESLSTGFLDRSPHGSASSVKVCLQIWLISCINRLASASLVTDHAASISVDCLFFSSTPSQHDRTLASRSASLSGFSGPPR
jgi:hypothetical protein